MMQYMKQWPRWLALCFATLLGIFTAGTAMAAVFASDEAYRLEADEVVADDLYATGNSVVIDGTVEGDLVAAGNSVEVRGTVAGDVIAAGASVIIAGEVGDDVRAAGAGVEISGSIGDDLVAAAGGNSPAPLPGMDATVEQGIQVVETSSIGGDAVLAGGAGQVAGTVAGDLNAFMNIITLAAQVGGDAEIGGTTIRVQDSTSIAGTLEYRSDEPISIPEGTAAEISYSELRDEQQTNPLVTVLGWLWRTALILIGFALLSWLILRFAPRLVISPVRALDERPVMAGLSGLLAAVLLIFFPLISALLVFLMVLFGGWLPGIVLGLFLFGTLALFWFLSPLVTGIWLGQKMRPAAAQDNMTTILTGVLAVAFLGQLPYIGWFVYLASFIFALGGVLLVQRHTATQPAPA